MVRIYCGAFIALALLTGASAAQGPSLGLAPVPDETPSRLATLGSPQTAPRPVPPTVTHKPSAWEQLPPVTAPTTPPAVAPTAVAPASFPGGAVPYSGTHTTLPRPVLDPVAVHRQGQPLVPACTECDKSNHRIDNLSVFVGLDGSKEPADLGINANFGYRVGVNWGFPILEEAGLGLQLGTAVNYAHPAQRTLRFLDGTVDRVQSFTTLGVFQRTAGGARWGVAYDFRYDDYYATTHVGQWRALLGYEVSPNDEIGVWATIRDHSDDTRLGPFPLTVSPISQYNFYWRHIWDNEIVTRIWIGFAEEHSSFSLFVPTRGINHPFTFGTDFYVPLTDALALFGEAHFITPTDSGTIGATLGIAWYPGTARGTARSRFAPLLPLANNTNFALDLR